MVVTGFTLTAQLFHRSRFDLDEKLGQGQPCDSEQRRGEAASGFAKACAHRGRRRQVGVYVRYVDGEADDVRGLEIRRPPDRVEIVQCLEGRRLHLALVYGM